jgi:hypothetical protein
MCDIGATEPIKEVRRYAAAAGALVASQAVEVCANVLAASCRGAGLNSCLTRGRCKALEAL